MTRRLRRVYTRRSRDEGDRPLSPAGRCVVDLIVAEYAAPRGRRRAKLTQRQLWVEYGEEAQRQGASAYRYSPFCALFKARLTARSVTPEMRFTYTPLPRIGLSVCRRWRTSASPIMGRPC